MGYVESAALFCATTKTVKDRTLDTLSTCHTALPHHLKDLADTAPPQTSEEEATATQDSDKKWEALSPHAQATDLEHVKVYLDDFIGITQGGPTERRNITRHLFCASNDLFRPNNKNNISQEEPISLKKLRKGDAAWSTQKVILGWAIDTVKQVLTLPDDCKTNLLALLKTTPPSARQCSKKRWHKLLGTLCSTISTIPGAAGMLTRLQHALKTMKGRRINLSTLVHEELNVWRHLVISLAAIPMHLQEIRPNPPTWIGATDASFTVMGGV